MRAESAHSHWCSGKEGHRPEGDPEPAGFGSKLMRPISATVRQRRPYPALSAIAAPVDASVTVGPDMCSLETIDPLGRPNVIMSAGDPPIPRRKNGSGREPVDVTAVANGASNRTGTPFIA